MKNNIKRAMDVHLSTLHASYASRAAIMRKVRGGKEMKRKLTLGMIIALTLLLIALGALAAVILTQKEFVDQVLSPKASQSTSDSFTQREMEDILRLAEENGVIIPERVLTDIKRMAVHYKEETMRLFAKAELGFYPSTWSIEDQAWYNRILLESGLADRQTHFVPEGDEISGQQALDIVNAYIRDHYDASAMVTEPSAYRRHMTYHAYSDNPYSKGMQWYIEYEPLDHNHSQYTFLLLSDGTVKEAKRTLGLLEEGHEPLIPAEVMDLYRDTYGGHMDWAMETWISFHDALHESAKTYAVEPDSNAGILLGQRYALPDDAVIPREDAIDAARKAVAAAGGPDEETLRGEYRAYAIYLLDEPGPVWKVTFSGTAGNAGKGIHMAQIDARTANAVHADIFKSIGFWCEPYVLSSLVPSIQPSLPASTPRPDGMPKIWYSDVAPDYYWQALDAVGYNGDTAARLMNKWQSEYGDDPLFWPLEAQAIDGIWHNLGEGATVLPGLPAPGDISFDKALEIARKALRELYAGVRDGAYLDSLKTAAAFTFNTPGMGDRQWVIHFVEITPVTSSIFDYVAMDAVTGEVLGTKADEGTFSTAHMDPSSPAYTPRPDGKPGVWYSDLAPAYYWEALDAVGYNRENAVQFQEQWAREYGKDGSFWPLWAKALAVLWHTYDGRDALLPGLPAENDISAEDAEKLAREALIQNYGSKYDRAFLESLVPSFSFEFNSINRGDHFWFIQFVSVKPDGYDFIGYVTVNAQTGEIVNASDPNAKSQG